MVFFAASLPMWRYQHVYEELCRHPRFKTWIVIAPASAFSNTQKAKDIEVLEDFFTKKNIKKNKEIILFDELFLN